MNSQEADEFLQQIQTIGPGDFEYLIADLWEYLGYNTEVTKASGDKGIDVTATREFPYEEKIVIQAKRYTSGSTVSSPEMQKYGSLARREKVDSVIVVSTGGFTKQALEVAKDYNIKCVNGSELAHLIIEEGVKDLVTNYTGKNNSELKQKRSPDKPESVKQDSKTTVGEGKYLEMEIKGYGYAKTHDCTVVAIEITNKSSSEWKLNVRYGLSIISTEGYSYTGTKQVYNIQPWQGPDSGGNIKIKRNSKARGALFYKTNEKIDIQRIEFERQVWRDHEGISLEENREEKERITIPLDESVRSEVNSIPDSLPAESADLPFLDD